MYDLGIWVSVSVMVGMGILYIAISKLFIEVVGIKGRLLRVEAKAGAKTRGRSSGGLMDMGRLLAIGVAVLCFLSAGLTLAGYLDQKGKVAAAETRMEEVKTHQAEFNRVQREYHQVLQRRDLSPEDRQRTIRQYEKKLKQIQDRMYGR